MRIWRSREISWVRCRMTRPRRRESEWGIRVQRRSDRVTRIADSNQLEINDLNAEAPHARSKNKTHSNMRGNRKFISEPMFSKNSEVYCSILFVIQNCILRHCIQSGGKIYALPSKWLSPFYVLYNQGYSHPFSSKLLTVSEQNYVKTRARWRT